MTHAESRKRRAAVIAYLEGGRTIAEAVFHFGLHRDYVRKISGMSEKDPQFNKALPILVLLMEGKLTPKEIAAKHRVAPQRVSQIKRQAIYLGLLHETDVSGDCEIPRTTPLPPITDAQIGWHPLPPGGSGSVQPGL